MAVSPKISAALAAAVAVGLIATTAPATAAPATAAPATTAPATTAPATATDVFAAAGAAAGLSGSGRVTSAGYVPDAGTFFTWVDVDSPSDCGTSPWCEIQSSEFFVPRDEPEWLYGIARTVFPADGTLPIKRDSGVGMFLDVNRDGQADYRTLAPAQYFAPNDLKSTVVERSTTSGWVSTGVDSTWGIGTYGWVVNLEWRRLGITATSMWMALCESGVCDYSPNVGTPLIDIKTFVDGGPPIRPKALTVTYTVKGKRTTANVTWAYDGPGGDQAPVDYAYRFSRNNGKTWSAWLTVLVPRAVIGGFKKRQRGFVEVKARNVNGYGPAARLRLTP